MAMFISSCVSSQRAHDRPRASHSSNNPCSLFKIRLAGNDVNLSHKRSLDFGPVYVGNTAYANLIFYTNSDEHMATNIVGQVTTGKFSFGGAFPGVNPNYGGCGYELKSNKSCKINLQFKPDFDMPYSSIFIITFEVNGGICKQVIDLSGSGMNRL